VADIGVDGNTRDIIRHIFFLHELAKVARVGYINAVPYTKVLKSQWCMTLCLYTLHWLKYHGVIVRVSGAGAYTIFPFSLPSSSIL